MRRNQPILNQVGLQRAYNAADYDAPHRIAFIGCNSITVRPDLTFAFALHQLDRNTNLVAHRPDTAHQEILCAEFIKISFRACRHLLVGKEVVLAMT